jgi:hypothetical protein
MIPVFVAKTSGIEIVDARRGFGKYQGVLKPIIIGQSLFHSGTPFEKIFTILHSPGVSIVCPFQS